MLGAAVREEALAGLDESSRQRLLAELGGIKANLQAVLSQVDGDEEKAVRHG